MTILDIVPGKPRMCLQENLVDCADCGGLIKTPLILERKQIIRNQDNMMILLNILIKRNKVMKLHTPCTNECL